MMVRKCLVVALVSGSVGLPFSLWPAGVAAQPDGILIGQTIALTGGLAEHGSSVVAGMRAYIDLVNAAGGVNGRHVTIVTIDDGGDATRAADNTRRLIERDGVVAMFGGIEGGPCIASLKEATQRGVPLIACMAGSPDLREPFNRLSIPLRAPHYEEFAKLVEVARTYGIDTVGFLHADSEVGRKHLANVQRLVSARGMNVKPIVLTTGITAERVADAIVAARVDALFNHGSYPLYASAIKETHRRGSYPLFMAVNSGAAQMVKLLGPEAKGLIFTQIVPYPWSIAIPIVKEYHQALARQVPSGEPSFSGLEGFASAKILVTGLRAAGRDVTRDKLPRAFENLGSFDLGGMPGRYAATIHTGSTLVDTVIVASDGRFVR
jgi:ABC-type branched-subunit amino acid transport system substrate-binding protein